MAPTCTLRERLKYRRGAASPMCCIIHLPEDGVIQASLERDIDALATPARWGHIGARDALYESLLPRLNRICWSIATTPCWDRDDMTQEGWIVFIELLHAWTGDTPFIAHLLSNFPWRLRDRVLRSPGSMWNSGRATSNGTAFVTEFTPASPLTDPQQLMIAREARDAIWSGSRANARRVATEWMPIDDIGARRTG